MSTVAHAQLAVVSTTPALNDRAAVTASVSVEFDRALDTGTSSADSFRVFGRGSGTASGTLAFSNGHKTVTFTPSDPFPAGEIVFANLANTIKGRLTSMDRVEPGDPTTSYLFKKISKNPPPFGWQMPAPATGSVMPASEQDLIQRWILHPGGRRIIEVMSERLGLAPEDLAPTERVLAEHGNMSSVTVLFVLDEILRRGSPPAGALGLLGAFGPGFAADATRLITTTVTTHAPVAGTKPVKAVRTNQAMAIWVTSIRPPRR